MGISHSREPKNKGRGALVTFRYKWDVVPALERRNCGICGKSFWHLKALVTSPENRNNTMAVWIKWDNACEILSAVPEQQYGIIVLKKDKTICIRKDDKRPSWREKKDTKGRERKRELQSRYWRNFLNFIWDMMNMIWGKKKVKMRLLVSVT